MTKLGVLFSANAWQEYLEWKRENKLLSKRIDKLILDTVRHPFSGLGNLEPLKHDLSGFWSRKINAEHRMVYGVTSKQIEIIQLKYHY
ncbi:Txe/YoeB family addiction module toxin [Lactobacillus sp. ESL0791]|uniref:Txe/YoeB family addiction module toxin n=1 Tax=Lactobacillus sp. ESL0791 TaxID=2983234 RepID=UPI0023FA1D5B|nr:Txe/YoeB family addiction module toxin [Lactobacillus sp. ESL0791]MDF7638447.1 Txe/YoeB family addiction module toxin [Lactobacillus sp. ESL0791]